MRAMDERNDTFGALTAIIGAAGNIINLPWTLSLVAEELKTGFGYGTNIEMAALVIWMIEILSVPIIALESVYFITSALKHESKRFMKLNIVFCALLILQMVITNLFIWF